MTFSFITIISGANYFPAILFNCQWPSHLPYFSSWNTFLHPGSFYVSVSVGVKSAYSPAPSTVYNQPSLPQRQVTAIKPLVPSSAVSTSYNIYPVSTSVQQPPTPISTYTPGSSFSSTVSATSYSGEIKQQMKLNFLFVSFNAKDS